MTALDEIKQLFLEALKGFKSDYLNEISKLSVESMPIYHEEDKKYVSQTLYDDRYIKNITETTIELPHKWFNITKISNEKGQNLEFQVNNNVITVPKSEIYILEGFSIIEPYWFDIISLLKLSFFDKMLQNASNISEIEELIIRIKAFFAQRRFRELSNNKLFYENIINLALGYPFIMYSGTIENIIDNTVDITLTIDGQKQVVPRLFADKLHWNVNDTVYFGDKIFDTVVIS
jgi:hypothetical protein